MLLSKYITQLKIKLFGFRLLLNGQLLYLTFTPVVTATEIDNDKPLYVIGAENISYYPHYDFVNSDQNSYVKSLLTRFADFQNIEFVYVALPIKRLQLALSQGVIDFAYPDNPRWHKTTPLQSAPKHYSVALTIAMGGTMVKRKNLGRSFEEFSSLAVPYGFTPILWMDRVASRKVRLVEVKDAISALELVAMGRVDGADVEFHVAKNLMQSTNLEGLVMDPNLPYDFVGFSLSGFRHPKLLANLDQFIKNSPELIKRLQQQFNLENPASILARITEK